MEEVAMETATLKRVGVEEGITRNREMEERPLVGAESRFEPVGGAGDGSKAIISTVEKVERGRGENERWNAEPEKDGQPCLTNRVLEIAWHIPWYGFKTQARLAQDSGVSPAAISRLIRGHVQPTLPVALRVAAALSRRLGRPLDVNEVFSIDGSFPTPSVCDLTGCRNCLPPTAYDGEETLKPEYGEVKAGHWSHPILNRQGGR